LGDDTLNDGAGNDMLIGGPGQDHRVNTQAMPALTIAAPRSRPSARHSATVRP